MLSYFLKKGSKKGLSTRKFHNKKYLIKKYSISTLKISPKIEKELFEVAPFYSIMPTKIPNLVEFYQITYGSKLPLIVLGPSQNLWIPSVLQNFGISAKTPMWEGVHIPNYSNQGWKLETSEWIALEKAKQLFQDMPGESAGILFEKYWSLLLNDLFVRAAIDREKQIHIALPDKSILDLDMNVLWDEKNKRPRVLGREFLMSLYSGYKRVKHDYPQLGLVMDVPQKLTFSLSDLAKMMKQIKTQDDLREALREGEKPKLELV